MKGFLTFADFMAGKRPRREAPPFPSPPLALPHRPRALSPPRPPKTRTPDGVARQFDRERERAERRLEAERKERERANERHLREIEAANRRSRQFAAERQRTRPTATAAFPVTRAANGQPGI